MTHRYAEALRWIADGKDVQVRWGLKPDWLEMSKRNEIVNDEVLRGVGGYEFRLKPRTVKIGSREIEAPVMEPVEGQRVYWTAASGTENSAVFQSGECMEDRAQAGRLFASEDAARAAHEAISALLRGEA